MPNRNNIDPATAGAAAATPAATAHAATCRDMAILNATLVDGYRATGILADLLGGRLNAKATELFLFTAFGMRRVRYVRQFSDGPWVVTGGSSPFDQQSFAVTALTVLYSKGGNDAR